jgi:hypothetical protein
MNANFKTAKPDSFALLSIVAILFVALFLPNRCSGSLYIPSSFAILSYDKKALLVMRSPVKKEWDEGHIFKLPSGQEIDLREKFQTNGIFSLDNFECIQPLNWFADEGELFSSGDLKLLVRLNRFAVEPEKKNGWSWCLKFYNDGNEVKQYKVRELVEIPSIYFLPYTSSGWHSVWFATGMYTDSSAFIDIQHSYSSYHQFILVTAPQSFGPIHLSDGNVFLFNAHNGEIKQEWHHYPWIKFGLVIIGFSIVLIVILFLVFRLMRKGHRWIKQNRLKIK